jgi:MYXO-CTERM domain-containing protein
MNSGAYPAQAFGFTGGFHTGTNTLDFFVYNIPQSSGNPEGLDVSGNVTYLTSTSSTSATPEPGFYGVLALGMAGLVFVARRHRSV